MTASPTPGAVRVAVPDLIRPIVGIENRTPREVFDIMADRINRHFDAAPVAPAGDGGEVLAMLDDYADRYIKATRGEDMSLEEMLITKAREALAARSHPPEPAARDGGEDAIILAMCRAHDAEESAAIGEPSPWRDDFDRDPDWEQQRFLAMREAYDVVIAALSSRPASGEVGNG